MSVPTWVFLVLGTPTAPLPPAALPGSALLAPAQGQASGADAILGKWKAPDRDLVIEVVKSGAGYTGNVVQSPKKPELVGKALLRGLAYDAGRGEWRGEVLAPKRGEYFPATLRLGDPGKLSMTAGKGPFSKEVIWSRP